LALSLSHSAMLSFMEMPPANFSPYSRANWTELQLQFRPPRDGACVSTRLREYASPEEISVVVAALQLAGASSARVRGALIGQPPAACRPQRRTLL
jgi:hypothetical protein